MKTLKITLLLLLLGNFVIAQSNNAFINANNIRTMMHSSGQLFWDFNDAQFKVPYTNSNSPSAIFAGGLWMGGIDPVGDIRMASITYERQTDGIYIPGLRDANADLNNVWKVTSEEVYAHIADVSDGSIDNPIPDNILDWPGAGSEGLENIDAARLADFVDTDGDGIYNPQVGDYPAVLIKGEYIIPDELLFTIYQPNDVNFVNAPSVDIHSTMYAFKGANHDALSYSLFLQQKIISREVEDLRDFRFSYWIDADLGCHTDDYVGCDTTRNAMITYNADEEDGENGSCTGGIDTYDDPPVISLTFLNKPMTYFSYFNNASINNPAPSTTDPQLPQEEYAVMGSLWRDGTPLTSGGDGYDPASTEAVQHAFPGDPNNANEWSMFSEGLPLNDPRTLTTHEVGTFSPGQILTFDAVINFVNCPGYLPDITKAKENIDELQQIYDSKFAEVTATQEPTFDVNEVQLYPNPSTGKVFLKSELHFDNYWIKDISGAVLAKGSQRGISEIDIDLDAGIYLIELLSDNGKKYISKVVIKK